MCKNWESHVRSDQEGRCMKDFDMSSTDGMCRLMKVWRIQALMDVLDLGVFCMEYPNG